MKALFKNSSTALLCLLMLSGCGQKKQSPENLSYQERLLRFTHFSDPSWTYQASKNYIENTDFNAESVDITSREDWGARPPRTQLDHIGYIDGIVIHHSLTSDRVTPRSIQNFHMDNRGWDDIAYHFLVARDNNLDWQLYEGRRLPSIGAHAGRGFNGENLNVGKIGIVMVGNFGKRSSSNPEGWPSGAPEHQRQPEQEVTRIVGTLINELLDLYPSIDSIYTHRSSPYNLNREGGVCPGEGALSIFEGFMDKFSLNNVLTQGHSFL